MPDPRKLSRAEAELIAERMPHRMRWSSEGPMPDDLPDMVQKLVDHALATTRPRKRKGTS
jgi:hypothetical protein